MPLHGAHRGQALGQLEHGNRLLALHPRFRDRAALGGDARALTGPVGRGGAIGMSTWAVSRYPRNPPPVLS